MTEDDQGNYLFYHYSPNKISSIDPKYFGRNIRTGRDERPGMNISMYYIVLMLKMLAVILDML